MERDYGAIPIVTKEQVYAKALGYSRAGVKRGPDVAWITPQIAANSVEDIYLAYGNEASIAYAYGTPVLMVKLGGISDRYDISMFDQK